MHSVNDNNFTVYIERHFANTGIFAIFLAISSIVILNSVLYPKRRMDLMSLPIILVNLFLITYLQSRISIFLVIIYIAFLFFKRIRFINKIWKNIIFISISCTVFFFLVFYTKTASSEGRGLILKVSTNILKDNLLLGTGGFNTFALNYPLYQADYFASSTRLERDIMLADNTKYTFNEPVQLIIELGVVGFFLILFLFTKIISIIQNENLFIKHLCFCLLFASCFYYIFHITVFQVILFLIICYISSKDKINFRLNIPSSFGGNIIILLLAVKTLYFSQLQFAHSLDIEYRYLRRQGLIDKGKILKTYFKDNPFFLTCYAHELFYKGKYIECEETLNMIDNIYIHSDLENLKGNLFIHSGNSKRAESYLINACSICPNRFRYKYDLFRFYHKNDRIDLAKNIALQIHNLKEKIPSPASMAIKLEIEQFLESQK
jgi:hypothetical protein